MSEDLLKPDPKRPSNALLAMRHLSLALISDKTTWHSRAPRRGEINNLQHDTLTRLIVYGAKFDEDDFCIIDRECPAYSTTGGFHPLRHSFYCLCLSVGNTSAATSWESGAGLRAWPFAGTQTVWRGSGSRYTRMAGNMESAHVREPAPIKRLSPDGAIQIDGVWWRVYQLDDDEVRLARYPGDDGRTDAACKQGKGIKRVVYTRDEFAPIAEVEGRRVKEALEAATTLQIDVPVEAELRPYVFKVREIVAVPAGAHVTIPQQEGIWKWGDNYLDQTIAVTVYLPALPKRRGEPQGRYLCEYKVSVQAKVRDWRAALPGPPAQG